MNDQINEQQQRNALKHCQRIRAVYKECKRNLPINDSYTHIPLILWEVIETMLDDETLSNTNKRTRSK